MNERTMPTCEHCGESYSYRTWLIKSPETARMCGQCEEAVIWMAVGAAIIAWAEAIRTRSKAKRCQYCRSDGWYCKECADT